jgi:signal peptidase I
MRKGMEMSLLVQFAIWAVILLVAFFIIRQFIVAPATTIPGEGMLTP